MKLVIGVSMALLVFGTLVEDCNGFGWWMMPWSKPNPTTPINDVGFFVWFRDPFTTKAEHNLVFDHKDRNEGNGYDVRTGLFKAPIAGLYHFYWNILAYNTKGCTILLKHNGDVKMRSFVMPSWQHQTPGGSIYLRLSKGDTVYLASGDSGAFLDDDGYSTYGGELIRY